MKPCVSHAGETPAVQQAELAPHGVEVLTFQPGPNKTGFNDQMWATHKKWFDPDTNFTRTSDMAGTAAILDQQLDPEEAVATLVKLAPAAQPRFRNVVPLAIENMIKGIEQEAWTRRI